MKNLSTHEVSLVAGGEIVPGMPSPDMFALLAKMMVAAGRGEPGFDVNVATKVLQKYDGAEFWNHDVALEYVRNGDVTA